MKELSEDVQAVFDKLLSRDYDPPEGLVCLMVASGDYTREQAIAVLKSGRNKLLDWMDANAPLLHYMAASKRNVSDDS